MRHLLLIGLSLGLMAHPASAVVFDVSLDSAQEVPLPSVVGFTPTGTATVDVNTITGDTTVLGNYTGMTSNVINSHLHGLAVPAGSSLA